jgi:Flp pilus assembly protein TadG
MARLPQVRRSRQRGSTIIEFLFIALTLLVVIFGSIELDRMVFVYTCLADAAKAGARYAIVQGSDRSGVDVTAATNLVTARVKYYSSLLMDPSKLTVQVTYPDGSNDTGDHVKVVVQYAYDPWTVLPLNVTLSATSQGIITF